MSVALLLRNNPKRKKSTFAAQLHLPAHDLCWNPVCVSHGVVRAGFLSFVGYGRVPRRAASVAQSAAVFLLIMPLYRSNSHTDFSFVFTPDSCSDQKWRNAGICRFTQELTILIRPLCGGSRIMSTSVQCGGRGNRTDGRVRYGWSRCQNVGLLEKRNQISLHSPLLVPDWQHTNNEHSWTHSTHTHTHTHTHTQSEIQTHDDFTCKWPICAIGNVMGIMIIMCT